MCEARRLLHRLQPSLPVMCCRYNTIKLINTIFLVVTILLFLAYAVFLLRPYKGKVEREACRLAGLLSHVPAEMDVAAHARQMVRAYEREAGGGGKRGGSGGLLGRLLRRGGVGKGGKGAKRGSGDWAKGRKGSGSKAASGRV